MVSDSEGHTPRGLYPKYSVFKDGDPVEDCFVLEPEGDDAAVHALEAYARATDNEELAKDIREWIYRDFQRVLNDE